MNNPHVVSIEDTPPATFPGNVLQDKPEELPVSFPEIETEPTELEILPDTESIVGDLIEPGDKVIIASGSKSYKTWLLIQMALCIS
ncbi:MAG TPA: hypothetical protein PKX00_09355, partial [Opitutaceae bacterium]|nr:hypothetical protein [Opitutaceae bacterium]